MHGPSHHTAVSAVRVLAVVALLIVFAGPPALAGEVEVRDAEELETVLADPDPYLLERVADLRDAGPEAGIRDLYETYERTAERSGHDLDLNLASFETIGIDEFSRFRWLDLMTLSTGTYIVQVPCGSTARAETSSRRSTTGWSIEWVTSSARPLSWSPRRSTTTSGRPCPDPARRTAIRRRLRAIHSLMVHVVLPEREVFRSEPALQASPLSIMS